MRIVSVTINRINNQLKRKKNITVLHRPWRRHRPDVLPHGVGHDGIAHGFRVCRRLHSVRHWDAHPEPVHPAGSTADLFHDRLGHGNGSGVQVDPGGSQLWNQLVELAQLHRRYAGLYDQREVRGVVCGAARWTPHGFGSLGRPRGLEQTDLVHSEAAGCSSTDLDRSPDRAVRHLLLHSPGGPQPLRQWRWILQLGIPVEPRRKLAVQRVDASAGRVRSDRNAEEPQNRRRLPALPQPSLPEGIWSAAAAGHHVQPQGRKQQVDFKAVQRAEYGQCDRGQARGFDPAGARANGEEFALAPGTGASDEEAHASHVLWGGEYCLKFP